MHKRPFPVSADKRSAYKPGVRLLSLGQALVELNRDQQPFDPPIQRRPANEIVADIETRRKELITYFERRKKKPSLAKYITHGGKLQERYVAVVAVLAYLHTYEDLGYVPAMTAARYAVHTGAASNISDAIENKRIISHLALKGVIMLNPNNNEYQYSACPTCRLHNRVMFEILGSTRALPHLTAKCVAEHASRRAKARHSETPQAAPHPPVPEEPSFNPVNLLPTPQRISAHLRKAVVGQPAVASAATRLYMHLVRAMQLRVGNAEGHNQCIFITGPSGSGKGTIVSAMAEYANQYSPVRIESVTWDCTSTSAVGYVGSDLVDDSLKALLARFPDKATRKEQAEACRHSLLMYDEFSKLRCVGRDESWDVSSQVQYEVLRLMEGDTVRVGHKRAERNVEVVDINTNGMMFIFAGYLKELPAVLKKLSSPTASIGFGSNEKTASQVVYLRSALCEMGLCEEYVNRLSSIIVLRKLQPDDIAEIVRREIASTNRTLKPLELEITVSEAGIMEMASIGYECGLQGRTGKAFVPSLAEAAVYAERVGRVDLSIEDVREIVSGADQASGIMEGASS